MPDPMRTQARFPEVAPGAGHYESFYIKATQPGGGKSIWLRHTAHKRPGAQPTAALWLTSFDGESTEPRALKQSFPAGELAAPSGAYMQVGPAVIEPGRARGSLETDGERASWDLAISAGGEPLRHLPYELMYRTKLPRTKLLSPHPDATFSGTVEIAGETLELDRWRGMVGHNWGAEHAERWIWMQASLDGGGYMDVAAGRIKVAGFTTPWAANGRIVIDGEAYRLGGFRGSYGTELDPSPTGCEFTIAGRGITVKGRVQAPHKDFVAWVYADPDGPEHNALNSSIANLEMKVERAGKRHAHVQVAGGAAYELGTRETDHGVPVQPYADG